MLKRSLSTGVPIKELQQIMTYQASVFTWNFMLKHLIPLFCSLTCITTAVDLYMYMYCLGDKTKSLISCLSCLIVVIVLSQQFPELFIEMSEKISQKFSGLRPHVSKLDPGSRPRIDDRGLVGNVCHFLWG